MYDPSDTAILATVHRARSSLILACETTCYEFFLEDDVTQVVLLGRWNWWPAPLFRRASAIPAPEAPTGQTGPVLRKERL